MKRTPELEAVEKELRDAGATEIRVEQGRKHQRIYYTFQGREQFYVTGTSPSDRRAVYNARANIRRILGVTTPKKATKARARKNVCKVEHPQAPTITPGPDPWKALAPIRQYTVLAERHGWRFANICRRIDEATATACKRIRGLVR